jgi:hypothetical protein
MPSCRRSLLFVAILLCCACPQAFPQTNSPAARKFDEFGDILLSDLKARLDNFAIQLQQEPHTRGFIIVYRTRRDLPGLSHALALRSRDYLLDTRAVAKDRLALVDGGVAACLTQEFWIVSPGAAPKPRDDARVGYLYSPDHAWKFYEYHFLPRELYKRFGVTGLREEDRLEAYANEVRKKPTWIACIIAYAQYNPQPDSVDYSGNYEPVRDVKLDAPGTARQRLAMEKRELMKVYGLPAGRIRTIDGGYRKQRSVELWIVPAGEPLPVPTPNSFPPKRAGNR